MTFHPRMKSRVEGVSVIGDLRWRSWQGVIADVWSVNCAPDAAGEYVSEDPRLFVTLDKSGDGSFGVGLNAHAKGSIRSSVPYPMSYIPAGLPVWGRVHDIQYLRHLDMHFDIANFERRFADDRIGERLKLPRLMFFDEHVAKLANLIADECLNDEPLHELYGDGLTTALFVALFRIQQGKKRQRSQLSPRQLRTVTTYIEDNCMRSVRLHELAELTSLSQSYFSHAFKASTGVAPHQWQIRARIRKVQTLLEKPGSSLTRVATAAGFSDQAHFTRVFKRVVGVTPAVWQRDRQL